mmetsp:Transcript_19049/g.39421  ORF Transcript_19049/g.39421 Transcript_19049/m.39421 type:complete len:111 (-) Transcript_19049:692-1024(-)|eukprot:CAMPEP_0172465188 /NCGR_PEP_ID=MMETSP1065-20121228/52715_1 /TAXON_ID=265537 /ORGANISM="Amphiprora paludosa, Strain CCMP125" /LENGTH=110 /DNA_ID=CAMNT_0013221635 /DNA_START=86 /DNA_END=421 /DNA_ORIENTATION=-
MKASHQAKRMLFGSNSSSPYYMSSAQLQEQRLKRLIIFFALTIVWFPVWQSMSHYQEQVQLLDTWALFQQAEIYQQEYLQRQKQQWVESNGFPRATITTSNSSSRAQTEL